MSWPEFLASSSRANIDVGDLIHQQIGGLSREAIRLLTDGVTDPNDFFEEDNINVDAHQSMREGIRKAVLTQTGNSRSMLAMIFQLVFGEPV